MALLEISHIGKHFNGQKTLDDVNLTLEQGRILCLLGPSGCGKTTLLRIIAGLETPDQGVISFNGRTMNAVPPHKRRFRMMFQEFALFPHKNVRENVAFGLEVQKLPEAAMRQRIDEMLDLVGLRGFEERDINALSGGERQRVALARSLAPEPELLMLDEPLGALDRALRKRLLLDLNRILRQVGVTAIFVTHDQSEAFAVADKVAVMNEGKVEQVDAPERLFRSPANPTVAAFLGFQNLIAGETTYDGSIKTCLGAFVLPGAPRSPGKKVTLLLRSEGARLVAENPPVASEEIGVSGKVTIRLFQGPFYQVTMETSTGQELTWELPAASPPPRVGETIVVAVNRLAVQVMQGRRPSGDEWSSP